VIIVAAMLLASASAGIVIAAASLLPITSSEGVRLGAFLPRCSGKNVVVLDGELDEAN